MNYARYQAQATNGTAPTSWTDNEAADGKGSKANSTLGRIKSSRQIRALQALLNGPIRRDHLDCTCGVSNGPDLIARLRARGLKITCDETQAVIDRDGREAYPGVYTPAKRKPRQSHRLIEEQRGGWMLINAHHQIKIRWAKTRLDGRVTSKAKAPVLKNTLCQVVAAHTVKRGSIISELIRPALVRAGMVLGRWAYPRGWPHGLVRVSNICPPNARRNAAGGSESHQGAEHHGQNPNPCAQDRAPTVPSGHHAPQRSRAHSSRPAVAGKGTSSTERRRLHSSRNSDCHGASDPRGDFAQALLQSARRQHHQQRGLK